MSNQHHHHSGTDHPTPSPGPGQPTPSAHQPADHPTNPSSAPHPTTEHSSDSSTALEKEFELERLILFTDAVFAIAITLLIIDIKWPDDRQGLKGAELLHLFEPTIFGIVAFATSFLYIGRAWSVHLRLFRLVKRYDQGLINRNLFFLFFIVLFPFINAGLTEHQAVAFVIPVFLYQANLAFVSIAHYRLCRYIIMEKPSLLVEGRKMEKKFVYDRGRYTMFITGATPIIAVGLWLLFPTHPIYILYSFVFLFLAMRFARRRLKTLHPSDTDNE